MKAAVAIQELNSMIDLQPCPAGFSDLSGWYRMPNEAYHNKAPGISSSGLNLISLSPAHYHCRDLYDETPSMALGTACHCRVLEPERYKDTYEVHPQSTRFTPKLKEDAAVRGVVPIKQNDHDKVEAIAASVCEHEDARTILESSGMAEASGFWKDRKTGVKCKTRPDWVAFDLRVVADLKIMGDIMTARSVMPSNPEGASRLVAKKNMHWQAYWNTNAASVLIDDSGPWDFVWIMVEPNPPHSVGVYQAHRDMVYFARLEVELLLQRYAECVRSNAWPKPMWGLRTLSLPEWRVRAFDETNDDF